MLTKLKRILGLAINDFSRNKGISIAAVFVLVVTIMLVSGLFFFQGVVGYLTVQLQDKIDVTAYFVESATEEEILNVKNKIIEMSPDIKNVEYVSKDQALADFNEKHKDNPVLAQALQEVGDNPFLPSLNITTNGEVSQYESVSNILQTSDFSKLIEKVDFTQKKDTIEKVSSITKNINMFGLVLGALLILVAISVVYSTIKLGIESSKEEISTMRIVGASDWFIRGPFIIQGVIYGIISFVVCIILSGLFAYFVAPKISAVLPGFDMFSFYLTNFWIFVLIQLGFGIAVGAISAFFVVKKYLNT